MVSVYHKQPKKASKAWLFQGVSAQFFGNFQAVSANLLPQNRSRRYLFPLNFL